MPKYKIITDSASDLPSSLVVKFDLDVLPLTFYLGGKNYELSAEENEANIQNIYKKLREGELITTSQINPNRFVEYFEKYLQKDMDIMYLSFSSALSGTFQSANIAKEELMQKYPKRKIIVIDTLCASLGQGLLVYEASKLKEKGASIEEVEKFVLNNRLKIIHYFTVDDLNFLKRGGRLSASAAFLGSILSLKPILHVSNEGKLVPISKVLGRKNSIKNIVKRIKNEVVSFKDKSLFISHGDCIEDVNYFLDCLKNENINFKEVIINYVGSVIGAHSGPGTLAIFYIGNSR